MKQLSAYVKFLEKAFDLANQEYFENALSKTVITIQSNPKNYGHFTINKVWKENTDSFHEINISAESLNRPIQDIIATLVHEMVHLYCVQNEIKDTSRGGTYHNKAFKTEAEKRGLKIGYNSKIGHSPTEPTENLIKFVKCNKLDKMFSCHRETTGKQAKKKKASSTRKYVCPICGISVRATKEVQIKCAQCEMMMENAS